MLIVAGRLYVDPDERGPWVAAHEAITRVARSRPGCLDLHLSCDPLEAGRINLYEQWESDEALAAWRAVADPPPKPEILFADVQKHYVERSEPPF